MSEDIQFEQTDGVGVLTLNRPASLNSLSLASIQALLARLQAIVRDDSRAPWSSPAPAAASAPAGSSTKTACPACRTSRWACARRT